MKVLLLEDDLALNDIVSEHLEDMGFDVTVAFSGDEALDYLIDEKYDLALLDINTPNMSGLEVLKTIREYKNNTPIIMITAYQDTKHLKIAFENGGDDYIKKPFDLEELNQRINKICRHFAIGQTEEIIIKENIKFIPNDKTLLIDEKSVKIAQKESDMLKYFCTHANRVISTDEFLQNIWTYEVMPNEATIRVYIKTLRELIGKDVITTHRGIGYKIELRV
ncbi:response regulator transcription factor [Arcobacteraceae bacterium]|nr:response regulator transcription factor [Arcobacteraceae bacterium]